MVAKKNINNINNLLFQYIYQALSLQNKWFFKIQKKITGIFRKHTKNPANRH